MKTRCNQLIVALPLLPGKREAWLRFTQEMHGGRREAYEASRRRLGIVQERFWLQEAADRTMAVIVAESTEPVSCWPRLVEAQHPFDRWFRRHLQELHGLDLNQDQPSELIAEWTDPVFENNGGREK